MENKKTAIDWLITNLMLNGLVRITKDEHSLYKELKEQAKEMEKEQIIKSFNEGTFSMDEKINGDEYYNKNFKIDTSEE